MVVCWSTRLYVSLPLISDVALSFRYVNLICALAPYFLRLTRPDYRIRDAFGLLYKKGEMKLSNSFRDIINIFPF